MAFFLFPSYNGMGFAWKPHVWSWEPLRCRCAGLLLGPLRAVSEWERFGLTEFTKLVCPGVCVVPARANRAPVSANPVSSWGASVNLLEAELIELKNVASVSVSPCSN